MSTRQRPSPRIPDRRLIVLAGVSSRTEPLAALYEVQPEAIMCSFLHEFKGKAAWWYAGAQAQFDSWTQYRYLDSGAFTFLRQGGGSRISDHRGRQGGLDPNDLEDHYTAYAEYLRVHQNEWDFVIDLDVDTLTIDGRSGVEFTWEFRKRLKRIVGERLLPVWHPAAGWESWVDLVDEYPYIAVGSDVPINDPLLRKLCDYAHERGVKVHGLGASGPKVLERVPFDTADSTTWLASARYGSYLGVVYSGKEGKTRRSASQMAKAHRLSTLIEELHLDREALVGPGMRREKYLLSLHLIRSAQDSLPSIPQPLRRVDLFA